MLIKKLLLRIKSFFNRPNTFLYLDCTLKNNIPNFKNFDVICKCGNVYYVYAKNCDECFNTGRTIIPLVDVL